MSNITMYDSITVSDLPKDAQAVAGYVDGNWPTWSQLPDAQYKLSITVFGNEAQCLDIEPGNPVPNSGAAAWVRKVAPSWGRPVLYTSASNVQALINQLAADGVARSDYLIWSAHYTFYAHICAPRVCGWPQADGTQWTDAAGGCDESLLAPYFFGGTPTPPVSPVIPLEVYEDMIIAPGKTAPPAGLSFPAAGAYTTMGLLADPTLAGASSTQLRVAFHNASGGWAVQDVTVGSGSGSKTVVKVPATADGVSVTRLDDVAVTIFPNFA